MYVVKLQDGKDFEVIKVLRGVLSQSGQNEGINVQEMKKRLRIDDALDEVEADGLGGYILQLEDAEYAHLKDMLERFPFRFYSRDVVKLFDDYKSAEKVKPVKANVEAA